MNMVKQYSMSSVYNNDLPEQLNNFLNYLGTIKGKSPNTLSGYKNDLSLFFKFMKMYKGLVKNIKDEKDFNKISISDIDNEFIKDIELTDLYAFMGFLEKERNNSAYARRRKVASLRSFFKYLSIKAKIIKENPTLELENPKIAKRNPEHLNLDESQRLLNAIDEGDKFYERDYCIVTFFLNCGMRLSELQGIDISHIKGDVLTVTGKGDKQRTVYLNDSCLEVLEKYITIRNNNINKIKDENALFISRNNNRMSKKAIENVVKKYFEKIGLDTTKYSVHSLRHTASMLMYKQGISILTLKDILGHSNISTTQIYVSVDDEDLREAVKINPLNTKK